MRLAAAIVVCVPSLSWGAEDACNAAIARVHQLYAAPNPMLADASPETTVELTRSPAPLTTESQAKAVVVRGWQRVACGYVNDSERFVEVTRSRRGSIELRVKWDRPLTDGVSADAVLGYLGERDPKRRHALAAREEAERLHAKQTREAEQDKTLRALEDLLLPCTGATSKDRP